MSAAREGALAWVVGLLCRLLDSPRLPWLAPLLAVLLALPALRGGLAADDWFHRAQADPVAVGMPQPRGPVLDMFAFFPTDPAVREAQTAAGILPWWTQPDVRGAFFRPLSALTHLWDWRIVGDHPVLHHAQSLFWLGLCVAAVGALFRTWLGGRAAALATLLFAVDDAHAWPAAWIANRNALLAMTFGALAARAFLLGAGAPARTLHRWLAPLFLALALGSAEAGSATLVVLGVLELGLGGTLSTRALRLAPLVAVAAVWVAVWTNLRYGIHGSGLYVDPVGDPVPFLGLLPERVGALSAALWLNVPVDFWVMLPSRISLPLGLGLGVVAAAIVAFVAGPALGTTPARQALAIGILALVPACAAFPMERVLTFAGMGAAALLALVLAPALGGDPLSRWRDRFLLAWHLPVAALLFSAKTVAMPALLNQLGAVADAIPSTPDVREREVIIVSGLEITTAYIPIDRHFRGLPVPKGMLVLAPAATRVVATREDDRTLRLDLPNASFRHAIERLCRMAPFTVGETVRTNAARVEVRAVDTEAHPTSLRVTFARSIDSPEYLWLAPEAMALTLVPWTPPPIGESREVAPFFELPE